MGRVNYDNVDNYNHGSESDINWFQLKNDKDCAKVQFLIRDMDDVDIFSVHAVEVNGKERYVDCLAEDPEDEDDCPMCQASIKTKLVVFIHLYNHDTKQVETWSRGAKFLSKIQSLVDRNGDLTKKVFEVERNGKKGSQTTTYEIYPMDKAKPAKVDVDEKPEILGGYILQKNYEELEYYLEEGEFENSGDNKKEEVPVRRGSAKRSSKKEAVKKRGDNRSRSKKSYDDEEEDDYDDFDEEVEDDEEEEEEKPKKRTKTNSRKVSSRRNDEVF